MSTGEWQILVATLGYEPQARPAPDLRCPLLTDAGRCGAYAVRPLVCRLWGAVQDEPRLACPHGCLPEVPLTPAQSARLTLDMDRVGA